MSRSLVRSLLVGVLAAATFGVLTPAAPAGALVFEVTDPSDNAATPNTLRWAIDQVEASPEAGNLITIAPGLEIDLTCAGGGVLAYDNPMGGGFEIQGNDEATVTQTCPGNAVMSTADEDLSIDDLTVTGGTAGGIIAGDDIILERSTVTGNTGGAGVTAYMGAAVVIDSTLSNNSGAAGGGLGAISVIMSTSTVSGNSANNGGGIWADQDVVVVNSTITGNSAGNSGGGVYAGLDFIELDYVTIVDNQAPAGANVDLDSASDWETFGTLIGSPGGGGDNCEIDPGANVVSNGSSIASDDSCALDGPGDLENTDPDVEPLADNGGPTETMLPAAGSPALDHADCAAFGITVDQRGVTRPQGPACDTGSVEVEVIVVIEDPPLRPESGPASPVGTEPRFTG